MNQLDIIIHSNDVEKIITKDFQNVVDHKYYKLSIGITEVTPWKEIQAWNFMSMAFLGDGKMQKRITKKEKEHVRSLLYVYFMHTFNSTTLDFWRTSRMTIPSSINMRIASNLTLNYSIDPSLIDHRIHGNLAIVIFHTYKMDINNKRYFAWMPKLPTNPLLT